MLKHNSRPDSCNSIFQSVVLSQALCDMLSSRCVGLHRIQAPSWIVLRARGAFQRHTLAITAYRQCLKFTFISSLKIIHQLNPLGESRESGTTEVAKVYYWLSIWVFWGNCTEKSCPVNRQVHMLVEDGLLQCAVCLGKRSTVSVFQDKGSLKTPQRYSYQWLE